MKLSELKRVYQEGKITKQEYIDKMYDLHALLFEYARFIRNTNICNISISDDSVIMTFRDSGIQFICVEGDKRLAPLDTLNFGSYEQEELAMQFKMIRPADNVFDIGANFGWYAIHVASKYPESKVFSFEPVPSTYNYLRRNIQLNEVNNIVPFNIGLSDAEGSFDFYIDPALSVNASMVNVAESKNAEVVKCKVRSLDDIVAEQNLRVDFIKCDVEGAELQAFRGGRKTISRQKPIIFTEMLRKWTARFNYHPNDIIALFAELGYLCFSIENMKLKKVTTVDEATVATNFFFLHGEMHKEHINNYSLQ
jgi:FkbM family methyltransferase